VQARGSRLGWLLICSLGAALGPACSVPREVHEPIAYPDTKISASSLVLEVIDARSGSTSTSGQQLLLPQDFEATAQGRLARMPSGQGPALTVNTLVSAADVSELVDARGEMTRVAVTLDFEVKVQGGPLLRRAQTQSHSDLRREEATPEEVNFLLNTTALDAFDRYWADPKTSAALNSDLAAYGKAKPKQNE
jgi:hypothetical protein